MDVKVHNMPFSHNFTYSKYILPIIILYTMNVSKEMKYSIIILPTQDRIS